MEARISDITTSHILVEFDNDTRAHVAIEKGWDQDRILEEISKYIPIESEQVPFDNPEDVPFSVGQSFEIESYNKMIIRKNEEAQKEREEAIKKNAEEREKIAEYEKEQRDNREVQYQELRMYSYPAVQEQLDALYWARVGVTTHIEEIDNKIKAVKEKYPKGTKTTWKEYVGDTSDDMSFINPIKDRSRLITIDGDNLPLNEQLLKSWRDHL